MPRAKPKLKLKRTDTIHAILWVAAQLDDMEIEDGKLASEPADAPPMGLSILRWVAKTETNRTTFFTRMLPKAMPPEAALKNLDEHEADAAAAHTNKLRAWLEDMNAA